MILLMSAAPGLAVPSPRMGDSQSGGANRRRGFPICGHHGRQGRPGPCLLTMTSIAIFPPASRHTRAAASTANPRFPNIPCSRVCCPMVATSADTYRESELEAKSTKKEHAKQRGINSHQEIDRGNGQCRTSEKTILSAHQRLLVVGPRGHHRVVSDLCHHFRCRLMLPPVFHTTIWFMSTGSREGGRRPSLCATQDGTSKPSVHTTPINFHVQSC